MSQAQPVQGGLFVCLDASRARPTRCLKQLEPGPRGTPLLLVSPGFGLIRPLALPFGCWRAGAPRLARGAEISPLLPAARVSPPFILRGAAHSSSSPLLIPSCSPLSSVRLPPPPSSGGAWWWQVVDGPRVARVGCSSVSPTHGCCCSLSSSSSRRAVLLVAGVCLPRRGPVVDVASSSLSVRLLHLRICFLLPKLSACFMAASSIPKAR